MSITRLSGLGDMHVISADTGHIDCSDVALAYSPRSVRFPGSILGAVFAQALEEPVPQAAASPIVEHHRARRRLQLHDVSAERADATPRCSLASLALSGALGVKARDARLILNYARHLATERNWALPEPAGLRQSFRPDAIVVVDSDAYTVLPADPNRTLLRVDRELYTESFLRPLTRPNDPLGMVDLREATDRQIDAVTTLLPGVPRYDISL